MKAITLRADAALLEAARRRAAKDNTTLNEEFRRWLADYAGRQRQADDAMQTIQELRARYGTGGRKFTREEMNER